VFIKMQIKTLTLNTNKVAGLHYSWREQTGKGEEELFVAAYILSAEAAVYHPNGPDLPEAL